MALLTPSNLRTVKFELKGIEEYLKAIQKAGGNIEEAVKDAIVESAKPIAADIWDWASKHELTGETLKGVAVSGVQQEGNKFYVEVGIDTTEASNAWHAVFVEYGTPTQDADPGIRPAFDNNKKIVKQIQKKVLTKGGIPVG